MWGTQFNPTVQGGEIAVCPTVQAILHRNKRLHYGLTPYSTVRCDSLVVDNQTMRCGAVRICYFTVRCGAEFYFDFLIRRCGAVWCGFHKAKPSGAVRFGKTATNRTAPQQKAGH